MSIFTVNVNGVYTPKKKKKKKAENSIIGKK